MLSNFAFAAAVAVFFLLVGWRWSASQGIAPPAMARRLFFYGINLVLGELYLVYLFAGQKWPRLLLFAAIVSWGVLLGGGVVSCPRPQRTSGRARQVRFRLP